MKNFILGILVATTFFLAALQSTNYDLVWRPKVSLTNIVEESKAKINDIELPKITFPSLEITATDMVTETGLITTTSTITGTNNSPVRNWAGDALKNLGSMVSGDDHN